MTTRPHESGTLPRDLFGESRGCRAATSWGNVYNGSLSRWRVECECGFLVENLGSATAASDIYLWHKQGYPSAISDAEAGP